MTPGDTRQITCHIGRPSRELRQANRHRAWRRYRWLPTVLIGLAWLAFAAVAVGVLR